MTLDLTSFTDFAQVESDRTRINLTRFSLHYPEKRDFFLEGAEVFTFGSQYTTPYYSRRIGITPDNEQVPILGGAKLTGKAGSYNIGALNMQTGHKGDYASTNYSVLRVKRDILKRSYIGIIATNLSDNDHQSQAFGADFSYSTDTFLTDKNFNVEGYVAENRTEGVNHGNRAGRFSVSFPNDLVSFQYLHHSVGENYAPEVGYVRRSGIKQNTSYIQYSPRPDIPWVRKIDITPIDINYYTDINDRLLTREVEITPLGIDFVTDDEFRFTVRQMYEHLDEDFDIFNGTVIPEGAYTWWACDTRFETNRSRPLSMEAGVEWGDFYNGTRNEINVEAQYNLSKHLSFSTDITHNAIEIGDSSFDAEEYSGRVNVNLSTRLTSSSFIQWNNETKETNLNVRIHFIPNIGSDIYFVYNHLWDGMRDYRTAYSGAMGKIAWLFTY
jgi:hypothetical protein